jgi:flagellar motor switch protein FliM
MVKFGAFLKKLPLPSSLHIMKMAPLPGQALLVVSAPLVFSVIDGLFGGRGTTRVKVEGREYTSIETSLIGKVVGLAIEVLNEAWNPVHPIEFQFLRSEFNPFAVAIAPPSDVVVVVTVEVEFEQECTTLSICMPYSTLEPIKSKLSTSVQSNRLEVDSALSRRMQTNIKETVCEVSVQLARGSVKLKDLLKLDVGDVLSLETMPHEEARIMVEGTPKLYGHVGSLHGSRAVQISRAIPKVDLINIRNKEEMIRHGR